MKVPEIQEEKQSYSSIKEMERAIEQLKKKMKEAAKNLEFEKAALLRDRIKELESKYIDIVNYS